MTECYITYLLGVLSGALLMTSAVILAITTGESKNVSRLGDLYNCDAGSIPVHNSKLDSVIQKGADHE